MSEIDIHKYFHFMRDDYGTVYGIQEIGDVRELIKDIRQQNEQLKRLQAENEELKAYKDVNEDFKKAWDELRQENERLKEEIKKLKYFLNKIRYDELYSMDVEWDEYITECGSTEYSNIITFVELALGERNE